jgi:hypothetical protein
LVGAHLRRSGGIVYNGCDLFSLSFAETIAMSVPVICPHCYKNIPGPTAGSDGLVHCDACGHAFPPAGASVGNSAPPAYKPLPNYQPSYSTSTTAPPPGKYQPAYPPAGGPKNPGNPGLVACGMIAMFGVMGLLCCGALGFVVYGLGNQQLANQGGNVPAFNPPPFNPPNFNPPPFNPPGVNPPQFTPPDAPQLVPGNPFEPVASIPGTPTPPAPKTLDDFLQAMQTVDTTNFTATQLLEEFNTLPVEDGRRTEVVDALLKLLGRARVHGRGLMAGPAQITLENWTSKAQATGVARFAADEANHFARLHLLQVLAKVGGDAETAKALLPLLKEPSAGRFLPEAFANIGPEAEEPLLAELETAEHFARITLFDVLGKVGGAKTKEKLQTLLKNARGIDLGLSRKALREIEQRELANTQ